MGKKIGLDVGDVKIGIAVSDMLGNLKWEPHFGEKAIFRALEDIFIAAQKTLA